LEGLLWKNLIPDTLDYHSDLLLLAFDLIPTGIPIINSDEIATTARNAGIINTNTQEYSNREAMRIMNEYLQKHSSFAIETNLADLETWKFLLETQKTAL
jgi:predicted ABC-type ATPase